MKVQKQDYFFLLCVEHPEHIDFKRMFKMLGKKKKTKAADK